jgi:hypothetical protein
MTSVLAPDARASALPSGHAAVGSRTSGAGVFVAVGGRRRLLGIVSTGGLEARRVTIAVDVRRHDAWILDSMRKERP